MSGWKIVASLLSKRVDAAGDKVAQKLAAADPETATQVDHERLLADLHETALKLADARQKNDAAQQHLTVLTACIEDDSRAAEKLIEKLESKEISEDTVTQFTNDLEHRKKALLPNARAQAASAQQLVDTFQEILDRKEAQLAEFDATAHAAMANLAQANADRDHAQMQLEQQKEINRLRTGTGGASTGLGALQNAAREARVEADAAQTVAGIGQKPLDQQAAVDEARRIAAGETPAGAESAADRLRRISQS